MQFRLMLYPKDFAATRTFYENTLNLPVINQWDRGEDDKGVMFQVGPALLELMTPEKEYVPIAGSGVSLMVADVEALWQQLESVVDVVYPLRHNAWGDTSFCVRDPEGFELTFFSVDE